MQNMFITRYLYTSYYFVVLMKNCMIMNKKLGQYKIAIAWKQTEMT